MIKRILLAYWGQRWMTPLYWVAKRASKGGRCATCMAAVIIAVSDSARAQGPAAYPQRNVQIVVPYTPGPGADILARTLGPRLTERWKVGVVADQRPRATGNNGTAHVPQAPPAG